MLRMLLLLIRLLTSLYFLKSVINGWLKDRDVDGIYLTGIGGSSRSGISDESVDKIVKAAWSRVEEISLIDKKYVRVV